MSGRRYLHSSTMYLSLVRAGGAVVVGILLPFAVASLFYPDLAERAVFLPSLGACLVAVLGAAYLFMSLVSYPGIRAGYYILPSFSSAFAAVLILLLLLRLDYSRPLLVASYVASISWYYLVYFSVQRQPDMTIGVVPLGDVEPLLSIPGIRWTMLQSPGHPTDGFFAVVADFRADMPNAWESLLADTALSGTPVLHVKQLRESLTGRVEIEHLSENAHGTLVPPSAYRTAKLIIDVAVSAVALVVLLPLLLVVALVIRLDSDGPVIFRQQRIGYRGRAFEVWKFRTMAHRAVTEGTREEAMTQKNDVRVTRVGRVLRYSRIDELPQLWNIVRGEMSLIGPRPEAEVLSTWYEKEIPFYRYRHIVRPGITGWAQVNQGHVTDVSDVHNKLHYDFYYISNYSPWIDIIIVVRTIGTMVTGYGSR